MEKPTSIRLPADLQEKIDKLAEKSERNRSQMIIWLLKQALKRS